MKILTNMLFALGLTLTAANAHSKASVGAIAAYPEIGGLYGSYFPAENLSLDGWLTLSTGDLGLSGHIPFGRFGDHRHSIVLTGMGGYAHNLIASFPTRGYHAVVAAGYGFQSLNGWDVRAQIGTEIYGTHPVAAGVHGHLMVGTLF